MTCSEANEALIWALVGLLCCGLVAPVAIIRANTAKKIIAANPQMAGSQGVATAALVIGIIASVFTGIGVLIGLASLAAPH